MKTILHGFCMAIADALPGVSGGTVAFLLGFYDKFIESLHDLVYEKGRERKAALCWLGKLAVGWGVGLLLTLLCLANLFEANIYAMCSLLIGLTFAAIPLMLHEEHRSIHWDIKNVVVTLIGIAIVVLLNVIRTGPASVSISMGNADLLNLLYIFIMGGLAISAMVLPGISGSTILLITGIYVPLLESIKSVLQFDFSGLIGVVALGLGIVIGALLMIRFLRSALLHHRSTVMHLVLGLLIGSLYTIVLAPTSLQAAMPALGFIQFDWIFGGLGVFLIFGVEWMRSSMSED